MQFEESHGELSKSKGIVFLHKGDSLYDEFFLSALADSFSIVYATFNPKPSINLWKSSLVTLASPLILLYKYRSARFVIYGLANRQVQKLLGKERPQLLVGSYASTYGFIAAKTGFHPFVLIVYGSDILLEPANWLLRRRVKLALSRADLVLVDSEVVEKATIRLIGEDKKVIRFPRFDPVSVCSLKRRSLLSFRVSRGLEQKKIVLHTRWFEPVYNVQIVIRAFSLVRARVPESTLVLVGSGTEESKLKALVSELDLADSVSFVGKMNRGDLIPLYDEADVYVTASLSDGTSASLLEAICRGIPVIVSDAPGNKEWIENGVTGSLFNPSSFKELGEKIVDVLQKPNKYKQMANRAKSNVLAKADWEQNRKALTEKLLELSQNYPYH